MEKFGYCDECTMLFNMRDAHYLVLPKDHYEKVHCLCVNCGVKNREKYNLHNNPFFVCDCCGKREGAWKATIKCEPHTAGEQLKKQILCEGCK